MYKGLLMAPDGDWVTDYSGCISIGEVEEYFANQGSRWYFYPFQFVIKDNGKGYTTNAQRIVSAPEELKEFEGKAIKTVSKRITDYEWLLML